MEGRNIVFLHLALIGFAIVWNFIFYRPQDTKGVLLQLRGKGDKDVRCRDTFSSTCEIKNRKRFHFIESSMYHTFKKLLQSSPWASACICRTPLFHRHARVVIESFTTVSEISKQEEDILWKVKPALLQRHHNQWNGFQLPRKCIQDTSLVKILYKSN